MRAVVAVLLLVAAAHAALWGLFRKNSRRPTSGASCRAFPMRRSRHRASRRRQHPDAEKIRADLKKLSTITRAVRLYSSTGGVELVPPIAAEFGMKVTVGAWIDKNADRNEREIDAAINLAKRNSNVIGVVVGNETIYRGEQKVEDLIKLIKRVKKSGQRSGHHRRNLEHLARTSRARLLRRLHRRARAALLGRLAPTSRPSTRRSTLPVSARPVSGQAHHDRGVWLAERRL